MNSELEKYPKLKVNLSLKFNLKIVSLRSDNRKKTKVFRIRILFLISTFTLPRSDNRKYPKLKVKFSQTEV